MVKPLDAASLRLLSYETRMLYCTGRYLKDRAQPTTPPASPDIYARRTSPTPYCAGTLSDESLAFYVRSTPSGSPSPTDPLVISGLLEAFLVHYRILAEFLCKANKFCDDQILAVEFAGAPPVPPCSTIDSQRQTCNKWLSHLSSDRDPDHKPEWHSPDMYSDIMTALRKFLDPLAQNLDGQAKYYYNEIAALPLSLPQ